MKLTSSFRRHYLIIELLKRRKYVSLVDLQKHLTEHDLEISSRTLQRDIEGIRADYQINIEYSNAEKGYFINNDSVLPIDNFLHFLEVVNFSELMIDSLSDVKDTFQYIQFENTEGLRGIHQLREVLFAIRNKRVIKFHHENFFTEKVTTITLKPLLIKEYQRRWYVVGAFMNDELRTFGIDRISNLEVTEKVFKVKQDWNAAEKFSHVIGVVYEVERTEVILSFDSLQGKYIKTLPLHSSQQVIADNEKELRISLDVVLNYELIQRILMYGDSVKVISPFSLKKEVKEIVTRSLRHYKKI